MIVLDELGNPIYTNKAGEELLGTKFKEISGWGPEDLLKCLHVSPGVIQKTKLAQSKTEHTIVNPVQNRTFLLTVSPITYSDFQTGQVMLSLRDITEKVKEDKEKQEFMKKLQHRERLISIGTMSGPSTNIRALRGKVTG